MGRLPGPSEPPQTRAVKKLVIDASFGVTACGVSKGFSVLGRSELFAPPLMWSEATGDKGHETRRNHVQK